MAEKTTISDLLPGTPRQRRISLTPLVDVIFLLLIFFMLTSQTVPFSLIALSGFSSNTRAGLTAGQPVVVKPTKLFITVLRGGISANGERIAFADIIAALTAMRENGIDTAIVSPRSDATVQDLVTVLEAVRKASFKSITVRRSR